MLTSDLLFLSCNRVCNLSKAQHCLLAIEYFRDDVTKTTLTILTILGKEHYEMGFFVTLQWNSLKMQLNVTI